MNPFETATECRAAFDTLLPHAHRLLRIYDHDLHLLDLDQVARHASLRAFCVAGGAHRIEILLDDIQKVAREHPRLMQLVRDFGHVLEIRQADPSMPRPDHAFVLADRQGVLFRADKAVEHGTLHLDDPHRAVPLHQDFDSMWQRSQASVSATTLGL